MENKEITDKQIKELLWENRIQTLAVLALFLFGIATLKDIKKKI
jgi:hypothetical protein